ncbi:MAG: hypothetical protein RIC55_10910 [Pirellulaceae bacterium]
MVIFLNEERAYLSWTGHHRDGYVLAGWRRPTRKTPTLHRASCGEIKSGAGGRSHWTTGRRLMACAASLEELTQWSNREYGEAPQACTQCRPDAELRLDQLAASGDGGDHLTRLGKEIVEYVVESAVIQLDHQQSHYHLTVSDVAASLGKTPGQISGALLRLVETGYLRIEGKLTPGKPLPKRRPVYPTAAALCTLPAFAEMSPAELEAELAQLE